MSKRNSSGIVLGQPSWPIRTRRVEAFVTETGGHLGPVVFDRRGRKIEPLSVAPWALEKLDASVPAILRVLRGDFFCLPFGGNNTPYRGERHPIHGETANSRWTFESLDRVDGGARLHLSLRTKIRRGRVDKFILAAGDHDAIYQRHVISGMSGGMCLGHHAMVRFGTDAKGSRDVGGTQAGIVSTSRFVHAQVFPRPVERPEERGYSMLKPGAVFKSLSRVPTVTGEVTDLSRYPARRGFEDIVMLVADDRLPFAWTAVTFPSRGYVWFALKDPKVLRSTVMWISNGGRHYPPWNGRHVNVMGLEEVTANFHSGLAESVVPNPLSKRGIATSVKLSPNVPFVVNYIFGVARIGRGFDRVEKIVAEKNRATLISTSGVTVKTQVNVSFLNAA